MGKQSFLLVFTTHHVNKEWGFSLVLEKQKLASSFVNSSVYKSVGERTTHSILKESLGEIQIGMLNCVHMRCSDISNIT